MRLIFFRNFSECLSAFFWQWDPFGLRAVPIWPFEVFVSGLPLKFTVKKFFGHYFLIKFSTRVARSSSKTVFETPVCKFKLKRCSFKYRGVNWLNIFAEINLLLKSFGGMTAFHFFDFVHRLENTYYILGICDLERCVFEQIWLRLCGRMGSPSYILPEDGVLSFRQLNSRTTQVLVRGGSPGVNWSAAKWILFISGDNPQIGKRGYTVSKCPFLRASLFFFTKFGHGDEYTV